MRNQLKEYYNMIGNIKPTTDENGKQHIKNIARIKSYLHTFINKGTSLTNLLCATLPYEEIDIKAHGDVILRQERPFFNLEFLRAFVGVPDVNFIDHAFVCYSALEDRQEREELMSLLQEHVRRLEQFGGHDEELQTCREFLQESFYDYYDENGIDKKEVEWE